MLDFFVYGEKLLALLENVGSFLLDTKINIITHLTNNPLIGVFTQIFVDVLNDFGLLDSINLDLSLAALLFGGGFLALLVFKLIKFITPFL